MVRKGRTRDQADGLEPISKGPLLTVEEVSKRLSVPKSRAYELVRRDLLPVVRIGRQVRIDPEELEAWIRRGGIDLKESRQVEG